MQWSIFDKKARVLLALGRITAFEDDFVDIPVVFVCLDFVFCGGVGVSLTRKKEKERREKRERERNKNQGQQQLVYKG